MGHEFYKPVQSRTKIQQTPENRILLEQFLYQSIFKVVIRRLYYCIIGKNHENKSLYLENIDFTGNSNQVTFSYIKQKSEWNSLQDVILYTPILNENGEEILYREHFQKGPLTLVEMLNHFSRFGKNYKEIIEGTKQDEAPLLSHDIYLKTVYLAWITTKNQKEEEEEKKKKEKEKDKGKEKEKDNKILFIFTKFINLYDENVRNVIIEQMDGNVLAFYLPSDHSIHINKDKINIDDVNYFLKNINSYLVNITNIRDDLFYNKWFALLNPTTVIPHELEHARRNSSHDDNHGAVGPHDNIIYKGEEMSFNNVANKVLQEKIDKSLVTNWLIEIKKYCKL